MSIPAVSGAPFNRVVDHAGEKNVAGEEER
jgi:hypothetical protein